MAERRIPYRPDIQGLRAIAIATVVLAHAQVPGFAGGFVGVDVFFVLSGFLITGLLVKERVETGRIRYGTFLARRLRRLLPALLVMLVAVLFAAWTLLSSYEAAMQTGSFVYSATWTSNFYFAFAQFDYFAALKAKDLFLHTWSLGIEEQFYVVWPWLMALSFAVAARSSRNDRQYRVLLATVLAVFILGLACCLYWAYTQPLLAFYMMPSRGWQFALGAAVFAVSCRSDLGAAGRSTLLDAAGFKRAAGVLGIAMIAGSTLLLHDRINYPGYYALFPSVGAALLIHAGTGANSAGASQMLARRGFVWLGDRSYSLYLWHWPVLLLGGAYGLVDTAVGVLSLLLVSTLLAAMSYRFVERPFWKGRFSLAPTRLVTLTAVLAMAMTFGLSQAIGTVVFRDAVAASQHADNDPRADMADIFVAGLDCDSWYHSAEVVPCETGASDADRTVVLIGDSIGTQWASLLPEIYTAPDWRVVVLTKSACTIADLEYYYKPAGGTYDVCTEWRDNSIEYLRELQPDIVFMGSAAGEMFSEPEWVDGTRRIVEKLDAAADNIVIIPGTPSLSFDGPGCLREPYRFSSRLRDSRNVCEEQQRSDVADTVAAYLARAASDSAKAKVLNLNDLVCPGRLCAARSKDGLPVFRDNQHLTASFVVAQSANVQARLDALGLGPGSFSP